MYRTIGGRRKSGIWGVVDGNKPATDDDWEEVKKGGDIPLILFLALDAYYLAMKKGFRNAYNSFVRKLHDGTLKADDIYSVKPVGSQSALQIEALKSYSVWGFYLVLMAMVLLAKQYVLQ
jgi:hypothetical protein